MILFKNTGKIFLSLLISLTAIYYYGCASAESTTGKLAFQQQDYIKAEAELKKGLQIDPKDAEGWYMLGVSQTELGKLDEARESFNKCTSISSAYGENINRYWIDKYNAGARDFKNGIDAEEKKDVTGAKSFYEQALIAFQASAVIIPDSLKSFSAIGETYLALGQKEKALDVFTELATKSKTKDAAEKVAKILFESGLNMMSLKNYEAAIKTFSSVLNLSFLPKDDPYYETSAYNKALALAKVGEDMRIQDENSDYKSKFSESLTYLEPLTISLKKKDLEPQIWELLVSVYANLGMTDKAQDALKKKESLKK